MKITRVEPIHLRLPDVNERCDGSQETLVVKVHTDAGIVGVGEVDSSSLVARAIIEAPLSHKICRGLAACVLGQNPFEPIRETRSNPGHFREYTGRELVIICENAGLECERLAYVDYWPTYFVLKVVQRFHPHLRNGLTLILKKRRTA